ncbi:MAG: gamma-glutamylcyclotransferase family protein [Syntrophobacteraceae bacterium]
MRVFERKSEKLHTLFVYGTLRSGFSNHFLLEGAIFLGPAETREKYALFSDGIPYATREKEVSTIAGEVYRVNSKTLEYVDLLEGHPGRYRRELVPVLIQDGSTTLAWIYFNPIPKGILVESGDYAEAVDENADQADA